MWYIFKFLVYGSISIMSTVIHMHLHSYTSSVHWKQTLTATQNTRSTIYHTKTYIYLVVKHWIRNCTRTTTIANDLKWGKNKTETATSKGDVRPSRHTQTYNTLIYIHWSLIEIVYSKNRRTKMYKWSWAKRPKV